MKERRPDDGRVRLGLFWPYGQTTHIISRDLADRNPDFLDVDLQRRLAATAEEVGFDFLFIADAWSSMAARAGHRSPLLEPPLLAAMLFGATRRVGIITTIQALLFHPAHVARTGATLDRLSGGRWGWNIVTADIPRAEALFGVAEVDHDTRYAMAEEFLQAVRAIWDSDDDRGVRFEGRFYHLRGSLVAPRPVQRPHPLLLSAASSPVGQGFAARNCDYLFATGRDPARMRTVVERLKGLAEAAGRPRAAVSVLNGPVVIVRDSRDEAEAEFAWIQDHLDLDAARDLVQAHAVHAGRLRENTRATDERIVEMAGGVTHPTLLGSPRDVAEQIVALRHASGCGGLLLSFPFWSPEETARFAAVLPYLREAGVWQPPETHGWSW